MSNVITMGKVMDLLLRRKLRGDLGAKKYDKLAQKAQDIQEWVMLEEYYNNYEDLYKKGDDAV